jgi:hypothetical protein
MVKQIIIKNCPECPFLDHTGGFTFGGAKPCCNHPKTIKEKGNNCFNRIIPYPLDQDFKIPIEIPEWCPLSDANHFAFLKVVNQYFIDLQNRCKLTPYEEKVWAEVSKALYY